MTERYRQRVANDIKELVAFIQGDMGLFKDNEEKAAEYAIRILVYDKLSQLVSDRGYDGERK